ncbi:50S ribosomal protein L21 [Hyphococcus flavus]|uniref:Large ribosomal subunit protein bL21 n=1 Tax=Hyphococcus flavus TaxID=1866326 RepID=A0AAE9ZCH2_9PROT|nr:50S ribosomal protein L21 [Hyphococcus flavus]WDI30018.1 50S ribosomal protein L21 [Hyphococcus flavus]
MYAVVKTGGKQYRVSKDDILRVERLPGEAGDVVTLDDVLMVGDGGDVTVGAPKVDGAAVAAEIVEQMRDKKIIVFKKRRRQNYRRKKGHRQHLTVLKVTEILTDGAKAKPAAKKKAAPKAEKAAEKKEAPKAETKAAASEGADDLKQLSGVGPVLEKKLIEAGVTSFAQIATWGPSEIEEFDEKLSFKGRIEREGWVEQAKELAKGGKE